MKENLLMTLIKSEPAGDGPERHSVNENRQLGIDALIVAVCTNGRESRKESTVTNKKHGS